MTLDEIAWVRRMAATGAARATREASRLSLEEVAREVGVYRSTIWRWERCERVPQGEPALRWAAVLRGLGA